MLDIIAQPNPLPMPKATLLEKRTYTKRSTLIPSSKRTTVPSTKAQPTSSAERISEKSNTKRVNKLKYNALNQDTKILEDERSSEREALANRTCLSPAGMLPPRTINEEEEDEIIEQL